MHTVREEVDNVTLIPGSWSHWLTSVDGSNISTESLLLSDDQIKLFCVASNDFGDSEQASVTLNITGE